MTAECAAAVDACQVIAAALESPAGPVAAEIDWPAASDPVRVCIALEGDPAGVAERAIALAGLLGHDAAPSVRPEPPPWWGAGPAAQPDGTVLQIAFWPGDLGMVLAEIRAAAEAAGLDPAVGGSAAAGVLYAALPGDRDPGAVAALVAVLRAAVGHGLPADRVTISPARQPLLPRQAGRPARTFGPTSGAAGRRRPSRRIGPRGHRDGRGAEPAAAGQARSGEGRSRAGERGRAARAARRRRR